MTIIRGQKQFQYISYFARGTCNNTGTDYCDLTGEPFWADAMVHRYEALAKEKKAIFCCMCGFDSIPADLGTHYVAKYVREKYGLPVSEVTGVFLGGGGFSGGTVASGINTMTTPAGVAAAADPLCLYPGHTVGVAPSPAELGVVSPLPDHVSPFWVPELNKYATYFPMAAINTVSEERAGYFLSQESIFVFDDIIAFGAAFVTAFLVVYLYMPSIFVRKLAIYQNSIVSKDPTIISSCSEWCYVISN